MKDREIRGLQSSFNPEKQIAKRMRAETILNNWFDLTKEEKQKMNPFIQILEETFAEPPFIPRIDMRTAKERRNDNET